jgi:hypothetical protein
MTYGDRYTISYIGTKAKPEKLAVSLGVDSKGTASISFKSSIDDRMIQCYNWTDLRTKLFDEMVHPLSGVEMEKQRRSFIKSIINKMGKEVSIPSGNGNQGRVITIEINELHTGVIIHVPTAIRRAVDRNRELMKARPSASPNDSLLESHFVRIDTATSISKGNVGNIKTVSIEPVFIPSYVSTLRCLLI